MRERVLYYFAEAVALDCAEHIKKPRAGCRVVLIGIAELLPIPRRRYVPHHPRNGA